MQMDRYKIRRSKINRIFISHLHGDHYFGLIGLLTTMGLLGRKSELHVYGPEQLKVIIDLQLKVADAHLPYSLHFHSLQQEGVIADEAKITVECFKVKHRIECWGFLFREKKKPRKIDKDKIALYDIPATSLEKLKTGENVTEKNGREIANELVTLPNSPARSYAFCADTLYEEEVAEKVKNVSLLYHETTYLKILEERAALRFHSTTEQAAKIAAKAQAKRLLIGHFSSKYEKLDEFLQETREVFPATELAVEGCTFRVT